MLSAGKFRVMDTKCKELLSEDDIQYAAILNYQGRTIAGGYSKGVKTSIERKLGIIQSQLAVEVKMKQDLDLPGSKVMFTLHSREDGVYCGMPVQNQILFIISKISVSLDRLMLMLSSFEKDLLNLPDHSMHNPVDDLESSINESAEKG